MLGTSSITIKVGGVGGTAKVLNRIKDDGYGAEYYLREIDGSYRLIINHSVSKGRERHFVEIRRTVFATETKPEDTAKASFVLDATAVSAANIGINHCALPLTAVLGYDGTTDSVLIDLANWMS